MVAGELAPIASAKGGHGRQCDDFADKRTVAIGKGQVTKLSVWDTLRIPKPLEVVVFEALNVQRPMNRVAHAHLNSIRPTEHQPDQPVFDCGSSRPNTQFQHLCRLAGVKPKQDVATGADRLWVLKNLRKTCATYYDAHMPESSIEILGHSVGGVTYRHYAHRDPLAFKAILSPPQPTSFKALLQGFDGECPCCRRKFRQA